MQGHQNHNLFNLRVPDYSVVIWYLKKNQSTPRPSEHPPVMGEKMSKRLGGIKGCYCMVLEKLKLNLINISIVYR